MLKQTNIKFKRRLTVAGLAAVAISAFVPFASSSAWGPDRTTFTMKDPAGYVSFNSITDNPAVGDERNFVRVMEVGSGRKYEDTVKVTPGKEYEVYIYFHNNAKSSLNYDEGAPGIARQVKVSTGLSNWTINKSKRTKISGLIASSNAKPTEIWDEAYLETDSTKDIVLKYVTASATLHVDKSYGANGATLSDKYLFSSDGVYIGENKLDGNIPGCAEYSGYITYRLRADQASSKISKTVSKDGKNFYESVDAKPGDTLTYKIEYENNGTLDLTNVTFRDKLPKGITLINGTTKLVNASHPEGKIMQDIIGANGFNTGTYGKGAKATITYQVKVADNIVDDKKCNQRGTFKNQIVSVYYVGTSNDTGEVNDTATIYVTRTCSEDPECDPKTDPNKCCDPKTDPDKCCDPEKEQCDDPDDPEDPDPEDKCEPDDQECFCKLYPNDPSCLPVDEPPLPKTGPGEIALAIIAVVCIVTGGIYWYRSQKDLAKVQGQADKTKK